MSFSKIASREFRVAFSKHAQPVRFRIVKYAVLFTCIFFFWRLPVFWILVGVFFLLSLILHFWYRHKTGGWTKSYGGWSYEKNKSRLDP